MKNKFKKNKLCGIYLISPPKIEKNTFKVNLKIALQTKKISCFQLRMKDCKDSEIIETGKFLKKICDSYNTNFILNDRADLAYKIGADGVHIGQQDSEYEYSRKILGESSIIGVTCHNSKKLALKAYKKGANYIAFGSFFKTETKIPKTKATTNLIRWSNKNINIPCVAIGGINTKNCGKVIESGADYIALISGIWNYYRGIEESINEIYNEINTIKSCK